MWCQVGDLVRISDIASDDTDDMGLVVDMCPAWPADDLDETMTVTVIHADGSQTEWYDFHLQVVSEAGWPGA